MKNSSLPDFKTEENSREFILKAARDRDVKFVRLWFTDILGMLKSTANHGGGIRVGTG
jgi:hypothetical protein